LPSPPANISAAGKFLLPFLANATFELLMVLDAANLSRACCFAKSEVRAAITKSSSSFYFFLWGEQSSLLCRGPN
jgi:hypothetical protein